MRGRRVGGSEKERWEIQGRRKRGRRDEGEENEGVENEGVEG